MALLRPRPFAFTGRTTALVLFLLLQALPPDGSPAKDGVQPDPGVLLVAGTQVRDPGFRESVILLLSAGPGGAMGLIINKPTATMSLPSSAASAA